MLIYKISYTITIINDYKQKLKLFYIKNFIFHYYNFSFSRSGIISIKYYKMIY